MLPKQSQSQLPLKGSLGINRLFKKMEGPGFRFFCASCKRERLQAPPAKVGSPRFFAHIALATAFFALLFWPLMGVKGVFAFLLPVGIVMEALYRLKMRAALICPDCQFDPVLYLVDREKAIQQVEEAWRKKFTEKGIPFPEKPRTSALRRSSLDLRERSGVSQRHVNQ
ncbi:hypothetical protein EB061_01465 [bacterium]|jgi:hypothetical protein|nr:hypothetical protein [bacterium]